MGTASGGVDRQRWGRLGKIDICQLGAILAYVLVRAPSERRSPFRPGGRQRLPLFERANRWVARQPTGRWRTVTVRDGARRCATASAGRCGCRWLLGRVQTKDEDGRGGLSEPLVVLRTCERQPRTSCALSNARQERRTALARVQGTRHRREELLGRAKGEVGLSHYEVRSWLGWHHHMTLRLLALWFPQMERLWLEKHRRRRWRKCGRSSRSCSAHRQRVGNGSPRSSANCCGVTKRPAFTLGTEPPESFRRVEPKFKEQ